MVDEWVEKEKELIKKAEKLEELEPANITVAKDVKLVEEKCFGSFRVVPFKVAKKEVLDYIKKREKKGVETISLFLISQELRLPADQVGDVLDRLGGGE